MSVSASSKKKKSAEGVASQTEALRQGSMILCNIETKILDLQLANPSRRRRRCISLFWIAVCDETNNSLLSFGGEAKRFLILWQFAHLQNSQATTVLSSCRNMCLFDLLLQSLTTSPLENPALALFPLYKLFGTRVCDREASQYIVFEIRSVARPADVSKFPVPRFVQE